MKKSFVKFLAGCVFFTILLTICGGVVGSASAAKAPGDIVIGVSLLTREHVFYNLVEEAMIAKAKELGIKLIVMDGQQDSSVQYSQIQDFVTQGVDGVILAAASSAGSKAAIEVAQKENIPVATVGTKTDGNPETHFQTDEWAGGELAGKYAAKALDGKGEVAIITYDEIEPCVDRAEGFKSIFKDYPEIKVVDEQNYQGEAEKAATIAQDFITKHPNLKLVFAVGDPAAIGAYTTFNAAKKDIKIIGYDGNPEGINEIKKRGIWIADVAQDPAGLGGGTVQAVVDIISGKTVSKEVLLTPYMIDADNVK
ncbi:MAG: substrate-binding domain-containing protein [Synergistaceae bacterium]|jgi:ribose transport system substrate-binding protein|nr:substrate-binding domain-containing protein [Synergistaceae bacterium]